MVKLDPSLEYQSFTRSLHEQQRIVRDILLSANSMDATTIQTRELIVECRDLSRKMDRLLKWR